MYYKAINFDLDTHILSRTHPSGDYRRAYADLRDFFSKHHFNHRQGSGYVSQKKMNSVEVYELIDDLCNAFSWVSDSIKAFDVTNVGTQYDLTEDIQSFAHNHIELTL